MVVIYYYKPSRCLVATIRFVAEPVSTSQTRSNVVIYIDRNELTTHLSKWK